VGAIRIAAIAFAISLSSFNVVTGGRPGLFSAVLDGGKDNR
jgi:predicted Rossmann-fold nucleotide-binding protein